MWTTVTNIYEIENLAELNCRYRLYRLKGLSSDSDEYDKNMQFLVDRLSRQSRSPCIKHRQGEAIFIAQPEKYEKLSDKIDLVGTTVYLSLQPETPVLRFDLLTDESAPLAERFLQFIFQGAILSDPAVWQPTSGAPYYFRIPDPQFRRETPDVDLYRGFSCRVMRLARNRLGVAFDLSTKFVRREPLDSNITADDFRGIKGANVIYEYGAKWYQVKLHERTDLRADECMVDGVSLFDLVHRQYDGRPKTELLAGLTKDCSVLTYKLHNGQTRSVPSAMCRLTVDTTITEDNHATSMARPVDRRNNILEIAKKYVSRLSFNGVPVKLSRSLVEIEPDRFRMPKLKFGNGYTLDPGRIPPADFAREKMRVLSSPGAGFHSTKPFDKQYFVMPRSVSETYGSTFLRELCRTVNRLYPQRKMYSPELIVYEDSGRQSVHTLGKFIVSAVVNHNVQPGNAVVMIPRIISNRFKKEDELANLVAIKLRERKIETSVIHTTVPRDSCVLVRNQEGAEEWREAQDRKTLARFRGYLRNVAIVKVLLLNDIRPFVLATPLHADIVIGIDVKGHTAGITAVSKTGEHVSFLKSHSDNKERLSKVQLKKILPELISRFQAIPELKIRDILVHRDGILFPSEKIGITEAIKLLKRDGKVEEDCECSFLEIRKSVQSRIRLFSVNYDETQRRERVNNPTNGTCAIFGENAHLISTGYPFLHQGTSNPLHIVWHGGRMGFKKSVEDTYLLTHLTWTKIDDCSRVPLSIKYGDMRLRENAGEFDNDAFEFESLEEGDEDERDRTAEFKI